MVRIRKLFDLPTPDRSLLLTALLLMGGIVVGLRMLPFQTLHRLLTGMTRGSGRSRQEDRPSPERIAWAVTVVSRYVPGAACLAQASAVRTLCRRYGYPVRLQIGVTKSGQGDLEAHAWVESEGRVVIGGLHDLSRYTLLPSLEGESA
jgi:hypothetical protein